MLIYLAIGGTAFMMVVFIFALMKSASEASKREEEITQILNDLCAGRKEEDE